MQCRLRTIALAPLPCRTRLPFRFGATTVTAAPLLHARVEIEAVDGRRATGVAADLLVPRWFRKDVARTPTEDAAALVAAVEAAAARLLAAGFRSVHDHWLAVHEERVEALPPRDPERLERTFGVALCERAMIDALCRLSGRSFWSALQRGLLGQPPVPLPPQPASEILVRHTVGMLDPLRAADIGAAERVTDGMPQALDEVLARHGVRWLKVKIGGGHDHDVQRLLALARLLAERGADPGITLDGNEQFADLDAVRDLWRAVAADPAGARLLARVAWIEQPLPRSAALPPGGFGLRPLVLDEGDCGRRAFADSGHDGVSVKNCKGVFLALANRAFVAARHDRFQTAEDLTNLPVAALQQDLATVATLGLPHVERNGHHYFPGLDHLPAPVADAALVAHPDLYHRIGGRVALRIEDGLIRCGSLIGPGYGIDQQVVDALLRHLEWRPL